MKDIFLKSYIVYSTIKLLVGLLGYDTISWYMKPFLIPLLILGVYFHMPFPSKKLLLAALTFSWIGDVLLLFTYKEGQYFTLGLIAFLLSHIFYIFVFKSQKTLENKVKQPILYIGIGAIMTYLILLIGILYPKLGGFKIPVLIYAVVICTMLLFAFKGSLNWRKPINNYILVGAILFISSDSILAFNKFYQTIPFNSVLIMITYMSAQYFITSGILKLNEPSE